MEAITLERFGGPEQPRLVEHADPKVAPGEVRIRVHAAGVNPVDWKIGAGYLDGMMEHHFPVIPGWDVAGVVETVGLDAGEFAVGDEVMGYVRKDQVEWGTYAELVSANVRMLARKPATMNWAQAAGLPLAGLTAYQSLNRIAVRAGETVLIHAAAGGVGSLATQLAVTFGARVLGTASEGNHEFLRGLGAEPVSYGDGVVERLRELAPEGIDAALDLVGDGEVTWSQPLLRRTERIASITDPSATEAGGHYVWVRPDGADLARLANFADQGKLRVDVERTLPLAEAGEAWRLSQTGHTRGKLVLTIG